MTIFNDIHRYYHRMVYGKYTIGILPYTIMSHVFFTTDTLNLFTFSTTMLNRERKTSRDMEKERNSAPLVMLILN